MRQSVYFLSLLFILFSLSGCEDLFEYHPYDLRFSDSHKNTNQKNIDKLAATDTTARDSFKFAFMGDTQRCYYETELFVKAINSRKDISFVIHGGDLTDFGMKKEFLWMKDRLDKLNVPYMSLVGNHDILGQGKDLFQNIFGSCNFSFTYNRTHFVCLNTNALEFDYSVPIPDFSFIKQKAADSTQIDQTIVAMHVPPGDIEFNNNVIDVFHYYLRQNKNLLFCAHAHTHNLMKRDYFNDGILYYGADNIEDRNYLVFTVYKNSYKYEVVYF
ncbi:MAG: metallophosphoesterase [Bacteroidales bacterium]|jgi:predicted phosphodiesterase|nr:metallophosphoesterase [Bacteroidales bacterium]